MIRDPLDVFLGDFAEAEEMVFTWETGSKTLKGIFDNSFVDANIGETVMDTTSPRVTCKHSEAAQVPREAIVEINGAVYSVVQVQPDGTGFAIIHLAYES